MKKIAIIHLSGIGNAITILPLINKIKRIEPNSKLDIILNPKRFTQEIFLKNPKINNIYYWEIKEGNKIKGYLSLIKDAKGIDKYDIVITTYPNQSLYSAVLMKMIGKIKIQHKYKYGSLFLDYAPEIEKKHFVNLNLDLFPAPSKKEDLFLDYYFKQEEIKFTQDFLKNYKNKILIGIHPGSHSDMEFKRWNIKNWQTLIKLLTNYYNNIHFFVFLGKGETFFEKHFFHKDITIIKDLPLRKVIALISKLDIMLSNDSGLAHIASLFKIKQIVLFGATDYTYSAPFSKNAKIIIPENYKPFYIPHKGIIDKINNNINNIKPEKVMKEICEMIESI